VRVADRAAPNVETGATSKPVSVRSTVNRNLTAKRLLRIAIASVCFSIVAATAEASQPPDDGYSVPNSNAVRDSNSMPDSNSVPGSNVSYPLGRRYYGAVDPNPIGYYPYSYYQGSGFPVGRAVGYYPYPDAHPYVVPVPYPYGYYGGYGAWPFYGFPGYGYPGWGWGGGVYPYGLGF
jgi:hypothetical protein